MYWRQSVAYICKTTVFACPGDSFRAESILSFITYRRKSIYYENQDSFKALLSLIDTLSSYVLPKHTLLDQLKSVLI